MFWIGFICGIFAGGLITAILLSSLAMSKKADESMENILNGEENQ